MKLYYSPGACSLSPHITLHESGLKFEHVAAPTKTHQLEDGTDYYTINPLGYVPLLELDDGTRIAEGPAIVQYIADQVPEKKLAPANGTLERYKMQSWLTFIGMELHRNFTPLFNAATPPEYKTLTIDKLLSRLKWVDGSWPASSICWGMGLAWRILICLWLPTGRLGLGWIFRVLQPGCVSRAGGGSACGAGCHEA
jgi:glutathione S-transferase